MEPSEHAGGSEGSQRADPVANDRACAIDPYVNGDPRANDNSDVALDPYGIHEPIKNQLVFLGTGTSHGVPMIGCSCSVCMSSNPKNNRTRCSVVLGLPEGTLLIDTPPELRLQMTRERIPVAHALLMTHSHVDHLFGLDDVRIFPRRTGRSVPLYCTEEVEGAIRRVFSYAFEPAAQACPAGGLPRIIFETVEDRPFKILGAEAVPIPMLHGLTETIGYRFGDVAYCTDFKSMPDASKDRLQGLDTLIIGCLRYEPHFTHISLDEALELIEELAPKRTYLTHMSHRFEHETLCEQLPFNIRPAYDGLRIPLS